MMKRVKRLTAALLAACLVVSLLPVGAGAVEGRTIPVADGGDLAAAVEQASNGDTIELSGTGHVNALTIPGTDSATDEPWFINKRVTIVGKTSDATISIRRGGVVLSANVTFKDLKIDLSSNVRNSIMANGYTLTLENVSSSNLSFNLFCGGFINSNSETFSGTIPTPGPAGIINIKGNTTLQHTDTYGKGNIYAGNLCMGGMNADNNNSNANGPENVFAGTATIVIDGSATRSDIGAIYGCGGQQRIPVNAASGKMTLPDMNNYTVSGKVSVTFRGPSEERDFTIWGLSELSVETGNLTLLADNSFRDNAAVSVASGAALNIKALNDVTIGNFTGGGSLVLWPTDNLHTLTISGAVNEETLVYTGSTLTNSIGSMAKKGHVYIKTQPSVSETAFKLVPYSQQSDMKLIRDDSGKWTASDGSSGGETVLVRNFEFEKKEATAAPGEEAEFPLTVTSDTGGLLHLDYIPLEITINGRSVNRNEEIVDGETCYKYIDRQGYLPSMVISGNNFFVTSDHEWGSTDSPYTISITVPAKYTEGNKNITRNATLKVESNDTPTPDPKIIAVPTANTGLKWTGTNLVGVNEGEGYTLSGHTATAVGSHTATAKLKAGYQWTGGDTEDKKITWSIAKADGPSAPSNLLGVPPTAAEANNGKITGTDANMEYAAKPDFSGAQACTGTEITGLAPGTYYVRVKETATHEAGAYATVKVPEAGQPTAVPIPTANTGLKWTGKEQVGVPEGTGYTLTGNKATDAGSYTATAALASGYQWSDGSATPKTIPWTIAKGEAPAAPTGLRGTAPTSASGANGKITGTTAAMQYAAKADFTNAKDCAAGETTGLASGSYYVRFKETNNHPAGLAAEVTVPKYDGGGDSGGSGSTGGGSAGGGDIQEPVTTPQQTANAINAANSGSTVTMTLPSGNTVSRTVWQALAGKDVTLEIETGRFTWSVDGRDVDSKALPTSLNLGAKEGMDLIPASVLEQTPRGTETLQISLNHNGAFAVPLTLSVDLGRDNAQRWANLYYYNTTAKTMEFQSASLIGDNGRAAFPMDHASSYAVVVDRVSHGSEGGDDPFLDVSLGAWYYDVVRYVYQKGLMTGTGRDTFSPLSPVTRGQAVTTLYRMAGSPAAQGAGSFRDVAAGSYYADAVAWAVEKGVATGHSADRFAPDAPITREQLAALLCRYARIVEGENVNVSAQVLLRFPDQGRVSAYAVQPIGWAVEKGLIDGFQDGSLQPQGQANRAQLAAILSRFAER